MKYPLVLLTLILLAVLTIVAPCAALSENPGYTVITAPELKTMLEENKGLLIHTLSKIEYEIQHIEGSINIPVVEMNTTTQLPEDKAMPLIFYCMGKR